MGSEPIGVVVGMKAEARIAGRLGWPLAVGGGTPDGARVAARRLVNAGAGALLSCGLAGGLDPALRAGDVLVPEAVLADSKCVACEPRLARALGGPTPHLLLAASRAVGDAAEKLRLWQQTGCAAVDLESGAVAEVAATAGIGFAALRVVCDPAGRNLPHAAQIALSGHGRIAIGHILASLVRQPSQFAALVMLAGDAVMARQALAARVRMVRLAPAPPTA